MRALVIVLTSIVVAVLFFFSQPEQERPVEFVADSASLEQASAAVVAASDEQREIPREVLKEESTLPQQHGPYRVVKVVDGDTVAIDIDGRSTTLRLIGLDTPETVDPRTTVQCFGKEASDEAKRLLTGTSVRLEYDSSQGTLDKYNRTLAYIYMEDLPAQAGGISFNEYMIAEGFGHEYTYGTPYAYQTEFKAAEASARAQKKGLWAENACTDYPTSATNPSPHTSVPTGDYVCNRNAYNCSDFATRAEAQAAHDACRPGDIHKLDSDGDGEACETLP